MKRMKVGGCLAAAALSVLMAGCGEKEKVPTEAERFGYTGLDLTDQNDRQFVVTSAGVTNWVPQRVLSVLEKYELSEGEKALLETAGVLMPGAEYASLPADFSKDGDEPWFTWWVKPTTSFGFVGRAGILSHYDEVRGVWETSESYFSSYWGSREEAEKALAAVRARLSEPAYGVKKFHEVSDGWIAENLRLFVMGVVGLRGDGTWSCMLDIRDKCNTGCGAWEPVAAQQQMRDEYEYAKALSQWREEMKAVAARNHELVVSAARARGLELMPEVLEAPSMAGSGQMFGGRGPDDLAALWNDRLSVVVKCLGVAPKNGQEPQEQAMPEGVARGQVLASDLYEVILEVFVPAQKAAEEDTDEPGLWRMSVVEQIQPGIEVPARPQAKK